MLREFARADHGQDLIEYALLASFLAITSIVALRLLGDNLSKIYAPIIAALR